MTSQHKDLTRSMRDLTRQHNYLTSRGRKIIQVCIILFCVFCLIIQNMTMLAHEYIKLLSAKKSN